MPQEYTYFRAEGFSREAIDIMREAGREMAVMERKLCQSLGAIYLVGRYDPETRRYRPDAFQFHRDKLPAGWNVVRRVGDFDFALPAPGSPDHFRVASVLGLMERAGRMTRLEGVFGCGEMPPRGHTEGPAETSFVRESFTRASGRTGKICGNAPAGASEKAGVRPDPLEAIEMDGRWYIRVPNKRGTEEPVFAPPDAVRVSFEKMIEADEAEMSSRVRNAMNNMCWGC